MRTKNEFDKPKCYQIRVLGHLNHHWKRWFDELDISYEENSITRLTGKILDQPQLFGLLIKIRDLGLSLISVTELRDKPIQTSNSK